MGIKVSKSIRAKLPADQREKVEQILWDKCGGKCFLCEEELNRAADDIEADHDVPEAEGGETTVANLNLAHVACNRAKRNAKTIPVRPYLKLVAYAKRNGGRLSYAKYFDHFKLSPKPVVLSRQGELIRFEMPDGTKAQAPIYHEENTKGRFEYTFVPLPADAIYNDEDVQPRTVRTEHAWSIYSDLQTNVLHEPPSCRLEEEKYGEPIKLLLFDGQHKSIANWMMDRRIVVCKVYLNLTTEKAILLVNSIQAKIKKLPLSPFELAAKMADEWQNKFAEYENSVGSDEVSESGFLAWVGQADRTRAKQALQSALIQSVLTAEDLRLSNHIRRPGATSPTVSMTEQALKSKVIEKLMHMDPLSLKGDGAQAVRDREAETIVTLLNSLTDLAFELGPDATELTAVEIERARRMTYQSALAYISALIRKLWDHHTMTSRQPMSQTLTDTQQKLMREGIERLVTHPVWTASLERDDEMRAVKVAFEKNQGVPAALEAVALDLSYLVLGKESTSYKSYWLSDSD